MYATNREEMKIFANVGTASEGGNTATSSGAAATTTQHQQREFRQRFSAVATASGALMQTKQSGAPAKYNKYNSNHSNNNKTTNIIRQATKYHGNNVNNAGSGSADSKHKRQQQQQPLQQQQLQQPQLQYIGNGLTLARKKFFGSITNNSNDPSQPQYYQQQQSPQQQDQQIAAAAATKLSSNNNNSVSMKNQNILQQTNENSSTATVAAKMPPKAKKCPSNNSNSSSNNNSYSKKRHSLSSSTEFSFYRTCSECSTTQSKDSNSNDAAANCCIDAELLQPQRQQPVPAALATPVAKGQQSTLHGSNSSNNSNSSGGSGGSSAAKQKSRQRPLSFWKNSGQSYAQQQQETAIEMATQPHFDRQKDGTATAAGTGSNNVPLKQPQRTLQYEQRRPAPERVTYQQQQQQQQQSHYYPYYYPQPKQLTIASFLQEDLLPDSSENTSGNRNHNSNNVNRASDNNYARQSQHSQSGVYQQRYRNEHYGPAYSNNYQTQQQQQHHHHHQQHMFRRKHNNSAAACKKMHYNYNNATGNGAAGATAAASSTAAQQPIEIMPASSFNAGQRRMQHGLGNNGSSNKNAYGQPHHYHNGHHALITGASTPTTPQHQNFYNLTYVNVDGTQAQSATSATAAAGAAAAAAPPPTTSAHKPSKLLMTPSITLTTAGTPPGNATATPLQQQQQPAARAMFVPPPALQLLNRGIMSPVALTPVALVGGAAAVSAATTPTHMISCAQLDEAITAAAASSSNSIAGELPTLGAAAAILAVQSPTYPMPFMLQQQHQHNNGSKNAQGLPPTPAAPQQQQLFFGFPDTAWSHPSSPCYAAAAHVPHCSISPASSTCSLASESHWSNTNRLPSPTAAASPTVPQLSPHLAGMHAMPQLIPTLPMRPPPAATYNNLAAGALPHHCTANCGCTAFSGGSSASASSNASVASSCASSLHAAWYELVLPPDRYLWHARNVELTVQPEQLLRRCKYDNLSLDIWKRFHEAQQTHKMFKLKMRLWRYLFLWLNQPMFARYRICLVGSTITGFGTDSSDIDMCLLPEQQPQQPHPYQHNYYNEQRAEALIILNLFNAVLKDTEVFQDFNLIEARVPILRFKDSTNGIEVDLNYNNCVGIKNTYLLQLYAQLDWRTRPLVVIVKLWAQYHDINDAKRMTISSYSLVLMVLHYLQYGCVPHVLPCLHALYPDKFNLGQQDCVDLDLIEAIEPYQTHNAQTLGEHLLGFFKYYSNFDFRNNAISIRTGGVLPVAACRIAKSYKNDMHQWKELNIEEPFDLSNTARSVYDYGTFERVKAIFVASAHRLEHTLDLSVIFMPIHVVHGRMPMQQQQHILMHGRGANVGAPAADKMSNTNAASYAAVTPHFA